ncbi:MAG: HD domain-containing protein [Helicobacteraceae bacterium]|jgi:[protein-PII] uridylyltransferase|nr:HD domain-containing protein [Helicobacteraceae bacterium]
MNIQIAIEDLLERNAKDFEISKLFKNHIAEYKASLPKVFEQSQGKDFLVKHTKKFDQILALMYKTVLRRMFGNYLPMRGSIPIALVALGSYGREQLCVHSDIDLMIVYVKCEGYKTDAIIEKLLYLAWDAGLKLGHRVHEVGDLEKAASEDITIRTAFMEARMIIGSPFTWHATQNTFTNIRHTNPKEYILAKIDEAHERRRKYPSSMQPNIKESVGGLRDSQLLFWIAVTVYGVTAQKELIGVVFTDEEYREYRIALEFLFRVRSALHLLSNKQQDQLTMDHMPRIAKMLGFKDERKMVTRLLEAMWRIDNFSQIFIKKIIRPFLYEEQAVHTYRHQRIGNGIYIIDDRLFSTYGNKNDNIEPLLNILINLEDKPWRYDPSLLKRFTYAHFPYPLNKRVNTLLRQLFERQHSYSFLHLFLKAGVLQHLIPAFKKVLNLPQFDGYHQYPVDLHSIECIKALENISVPFIKGLYDALTPKERTLLKIATLLHDTGKGRKQDHSEVGVKLIVPFTKRLDFTKEEQDLTALLVRHHVLMTNVAYRENLNNEKTLYKFMSNIKTQKNLTLLYILTYADVNGVGPGTWTTFSSNLLRELYDAAMEISQQNERISDAAKRIAIEKRIKNRESFKELPRTMQKKVLGIDSNLFYFQHSPEEIINIANEARNVKAYRYTLDTSGDGLSIQIVRRVPLNLTYLLGKFSYLDVASMKVFTLFDDLKLFTIDFLHLPEFDSLEHVEEIIEDSFDMSHKLTLEQPVIHEKEIDLDCEHSKTYAQININTANQRGLLAYIMNAFDELDINLASAKIHSTKKRVRDHFLIEKQNQMCDNADQLISILTKGNN